MKSKAILASIGCLILSGCLTACTATTNTGKLTFDVNGPGLTHHTEVPAFSSTTTVDPVEFAKVAMEKIATLPLPTLLGG